MSARFGMYRQQQDFEKKQLDRKSDLEKSLNETRIELDNLAQSEGCLIMNELWKNN